MTAAPSSVESLGRKPVDAGLIALVMLARFHGVAVEPEALRHQFALGDRPFGTDEILRAAKLLNLKARCVAGERAELPIFFIFAPLLTSLPIGYFLFELGRLIDIDRRQGDA